jgi:hypothetical protein
LARSGRPGEARREQTLDGGLRKGITCYGCGKHNVLRRTRLMMGATMIVAIVTFNLPDLTSLEEITKVFQATAPKYQGMPGLLRKNYWVSEDGRRAGGMYVWESRAAADRIYTSEWKKFVEGKYGAPPVIEYFHSPVMVDNREGSIVVAA